jgi:hypothetical protein
VLHTAFIKMKMPRPNSDMRSNMVSSVHTQTATRPHLMPLPLELGTEGRWELVEDVVDTLWLLCPGQREATFVEHALKHPNP